MITASLPTSWRSAQCPYSRHRSGTSSRVARFGGSTAGVGVRSVSHQPLLLVGAEFENVDPALSDVPVASVPGSTDANQAPHCVRQELDSWSKTLSGWPNGRKQRADRSQSHRVTPQGSLEEDPRSDDKQHSLILRSICRLFRDCGVRDLVSSPSGRPGSSAVRET